MKTILTITMFALAASATTPAFASAEGDCEGWDIWGPNCGLKVEKIDELNDPDQADNQRDVADSGNEGSTSVASTSDE